MALLHPRHWHREMMMKEKRAEIGKAHQFEEQYHRSGKHLNLPQIILVTRVILVTRATLHTLL
jgi:hypothetical protein